MSHNPYDKIQTTLAARLAGMVEQWREEAPSNLGSPIERILYVAILAEVYFGGHEIERVFDAGRPDVDLDLLRKTIEERKEYGSIIIQSQAQIDDWRVDFLIHYYDQGWPDRKTGWRKFVVECDGHNFHERTADQAMRDRSRDRRHVRGDMPVLRFTGTEINRRPNECAIEVLDMASRGF